SELFFGQPGLSPPRTPGVFGQKSSTSAIWSPSLSGSGQPSSSWNPSRSSGSFGHLSLTSGTPSASLSASGQPSSSRYPSLSSGSRMHWSRESAMPSPSVSFGVGSEISTNSRELQRSGGLISNAAAAFG